MRIFLAIFQGQPRAWVDVAYQAVLSLGPAIVTAVVSWLAFRSQLKIKDKEINAQARLRARELRFNAYQGLIERREKEAIEIGKVLGPLGIAFQVARDKDEELKARLALMEQMGSILTPLRGVMGQLESDLAKAGLLDQFRSQVEFIKSQAATNLLQIPYDEVPSYYETAMTVLSYSTLINQALLEKRRDDLFRDYLSE